MAADAGSQSPDKRAERRAALASVREKAMITLTGFLLTGVLGTMVTTWIQQRGWAWQNRVAKIEKDTQNVMATYRSAAELVNARWLANYQMARALEREPLTGDKPSPGWRHAVDAFAQADREWTLRFTNVAREIEFYVDAPFAIDPTQSLSAVYALTCDVDPWRSGATLEARSARLAIEIVNHCQARVKEAIQPLVDDREAGRPIDGVARTSAVNLAFRTLDHVYRANETLRCVIFDRALTIRSQLENDSYWGTFFGVGGPAYRLPERPRGCAPS
jgi:hypothetical protein